MDVSYLEHKLTPAERETFDRDGFFAVEDALSPAQVAALTAVTDRIYEAKLAGRDQVKGPGGVGSDQGVSRPHSLTRVKPV